MRNATGSGILWTGVTDYRSSYVTAVRNGVYGIYAFDSSWRHNAAAIVPDTRRLVRRRQPARPRGPHPYHGHTDR